MTTDIRFELTLNSFPNDAAVPRACEIIYQLNDTNLIAAMHVTPYRVGRSFSREEQTRLSADLKEALIGHRFKALSPNSEEIIFDPKAATPSIAHDNSEPSPSSPASRWVLWSSITIAFVLILSIILRWQMTESLAPSIELKPFSTAEPIEQIPNLFQAELAVIKGRVEIRKHNSLKWADASFGQKLGEGDGLRTYENASARIIYPDGNFVVVRENSLLMLGPANQETQINGLNREVELKDGRLRARLKAASPQESWLIRTQKGDLKISSQTASTPTDVISQVTENSLQFQLTEGTASFQPVDRKLEPIQIEKNQQIRAKDSTAPLIEDFIPEIRLLSPTANNTLFLKTSGKNEFSFEWEAFRDDVEYHWKIYLDAQKGDPILSQKTSAEKVEVSYLDPGEIYWQVTCVIDGVEYSSPLEKVYVEISDY